LPRSRSRSCTCNKSQTCCPPIPPAFGSVPGRNRVPEKTPDHPANDGAVDCGRRVLFKAQGSAKKVKSLGRHNGRPSQASVAQASQHRPRTLHRLCFSYAGRAGAQCLLDVFDFARPPDGLRAASHSSPTGNHCEALRIASLSELIHDLGRSALGIEWPRSRLHDATIPASRVKAAILSIFSELRLRRTTFYREPAISGRRPRGLLIDLPAKQSQILDISHLQR